MCFSQQAYRFPLTASRLFVSTNSFITTCTYKQKLCSNAWEFKLKLAEGENLEFKVGQFVIFDVPLIENPEDFQPRAYSIASSPSSKHELTFLITYKEGGRASRWVDEVLKVGDEVKMKGPFGAFTVDTETDKEYVFIGTGSGIVPFMSILLWLLEEQKDTRQMHLFFGVHNEECVFWKDEFENLANEYSNLHFHLCLSQPSDKWSGLCGRVTKVVPEIITDFSNVSAYVCGNPDMVIQAKENLQREISQGDLHSEGYV